MLLRRIFFKCLLFKQHKIRQKFVRAAITGILTSVGTLIIVANI